MLTVLPVVADTHAAILQGKEDQEKVPIYFWPKKPNKIKI